MKKQRNELGQFTRENYDFVIKIPGPVTIFRAFVIIFLLSPWIFIIFYKLNVFQLFQVLMENMLSLSHGAEHIEENGKKTSGFF